MYIRIPRIVRTFRYVYYNMHVFQHGYSDVYIHFPRMIHNSWFSYDECVHYEKYSDMYSCYARDIARQLRSQFRYDGYVYSDVYLSTLPRICEASSLPNLHCLIGMWWIFVFGCVHSDTSEHLRGSFSTKFVLSCFLCVMDMHIRMCAFWYTYQREFARQICSRRQS